MPMGGMELLIILVIILLLFGATRVPQLGRSLGQSLREFRKGVSEDSDNELGEPKERKICHQCGVKFSDLTRANGGYCWPSQ